MRCPECGALNPDTAEWCGQCVTAVGGAQAPDATARVPDTAADARAAAGSSDVASPRDDGTDRSETADAGGREGFRTTGEGIDWQCAYCGSWNPLEVTTCAVCTQTFTETLRRRRGLDVEAETPGREVSENVALVATALVPGSGHWLLGHAGMGIARAVIYVLWLVGGLLLSVAAGSNQQSIWPGLTLLLGAFVVWLGSVLDVVNLGRGNAEVLRPRVFFWLVVGVLGLLMLTFFVSALSVTTRAGASPAG